MGKFLIVTSFYNNTKKHVQTTFDNVLKQSHQDWMLIVGDDFSDDPEFRTYLKNQVVSINDPRIIYYDIKYKRELYLYQNFFQEYQYDYYFDLDSDDIIDQHILKIYNDHFDKYPNVNSIYSDFNKVDEKNNLQMLSLVKSPSNFLKEFQFRSTQDFSTIYSKRSGQHMFGVARAMRNPKQDKLQIRELCRTATDSLFLFFSLTKGDHLHIPRKLYTYINRPNSDSSWMPPEEISKFNLNVQDYLKQYKNSSYTFPNPYKEIWHETSALSSCNWLENTNELCVITNPNIDINLLKDLYPDKKIVLNDFTHKNQIVVWNNLPQEIKSKLQLNNTFNCTVFFSDDNYSYSPPEITQNFNASSISFRKELNQYLTGYSWYDYFRQCIVTKKTLPKLLIITPHLSTGGSPQYILDYLKYYKNEYSEIKLVEFTEFSWEYVIQKNKLIKLLGKENVYTLGKYGSKTFDTDKEQLIPILEIYKPDVIWMNEVPEAYEYKLPPDSVMNTIYSPDREYKIIETTHFNALDFKTKKFIPDEFMFCSLNHIKESEHLDIPKKVWQSPIENKQKPDRNSTLIELGLDPNKYHVLNVGLINFNKNQKYIFNIAEQTLDLPIQYHFIGNHCFFNETGITQQQKELSNCKLWGERSDVDKFMSCMDLYLFPSKKELNPLTIKEALSWGMDVIANYDLNYTNQYTHLDNFNLIQDINVIDFMKNRIPQPSNPNKIHISFIQGAKVEILGDTPLEYHVKFYNNNNGELIHEDYIKNNMWTKPNIEYFVEWKIEIWNKNQLIHTEILNLENKKVYIHLDSKSIGDTLAWFPYIEEFRKKHNCEVICSTFKNFLFESTYPNIRFVPPGSSVNAHVQYNIGWFDNTFKNPINPYTLPLQQTATDILGLEYKEVKPKLSISLQKPSIKEKYVTLSIQSTAQCKYWNYKGGWQKIVNYLNLRGYKVVCIDKHAHFGVQGCMNSMPNNVIDKTGCSLEEASSLIKGAKFHLGISSGLSWLAWALGSHVVMISSFSKPFCEFTKKITRIYTDTPYSGYFNDPDYKLDASNWHWNPYLEMSTLEEWHDFETITPKQVIKEINKLL